MNNQPINLTERLAAGDEAAFAELLDALGPKLHRAARRMLYSAAEADDALQDCFVDLVRGRHRLLQVEDVNSYVFRMLFRATYRIINRRTDRQIETHELSDMTDSRSASTIDVIDDTEELEFAVSQLPHEQREVIVLKTDGGMTFQEIAAFLGISANTAASRYRYAIDKLRTYLVQESCETKMNCS